MSRLPLRFGHPASTQVNRAGRDAVRTRLAGWIAVPAMAAVLAWPALWNGFPLIFPDTGGYLMRPLDGTLALGRSALYGAFLLAGMPFDFWPNIAAQAIVTVFVIRALLRSHNLGTEPTLVVVLGLAALSSLPWYVSQLMPDILVGWAVLALYLLALPRAALGPVEAMVLAALVALAVASHMATLALCLGLILCFCLLRLLAGRIRLPPPRLAVPALAVAAGMFLSPLSNYVIARQFAFTPGGTAFIFGRLLQDGLIGRYLDERCPDDAIRLCEYKDALPGTADEWLWTYASPIHKLGGADGFAPEARRLILETLRLYPAGHARAAAAAAVVQFVSFRAGLAVSRGDNFDVYDTFARVLAPAANARFFAARQQREQPDISMINLVQVPVAAISLGLVTFLALFGARAQLGLSARMLCATVLLALLGNAVICGIFSNPHDRYQNRVIWIAVLAATIAVAEWWRGRTRPG